MKTKEVIEQQRRVIVSLVEIVTLILDELPHIPKDVSVGLFEVAYNNDLIRPEIVQHLEQS